MVKICHLTVAKRLSMTIELKSNKITKNRFPQPYLQKYTTLSFLHLAEWKQDKLENCFQK